MNQIEVTEADVLRGEKAILLETRNGPTEFVYCRGLNWAAAIGVSAESDPAQALIKTVLLGVRKDQANDEFLDKFTPTSLVAISNVVMTLTHGVDALKKLKAARKETEAAPVTPISAPPVTVSENQDLPEASCAVAAQPS